MPSSRFIKMCDYCDQVPAALRVPAYRSSVCKSCYIDHHGPCDELEQEAEEERAAQHGLVQVVEHSGLCNV